MPRKTRIVLMVLLILVAATSKQASAKIMGPDPSIAPPPIALVSTMDTGIDIANTNMVHTNTALVITDLVLSETEQIVPARGSSPGVLATSGPKTSTDYVMSDNYNGARRADKGDVDFHDLATAGDPEGRCTGATAQKDLAATLTNTTT